MATGFTEKNLRGSRWASRWLVVQIDEKELKSLIKDLESLICLIVKTKHY